MLTTYHGARTAGITRRKAGGGEEDITKPCAVIDYTAKMGGVDRADHYCASYHFARKSKKWWRKVFFWLLEIAVMNALIILNLGRSSQGLQKVSFFLPKC